MATVIEFLCAIAAACAAYSCARGVDPEGPELGATSTASGAGVGSTGSSAGAASSGGASSTSSASASAQGGATGSGGAGTGASGGGGAAAASTGGGGAPVGLVLEYKCAFTSPSGQEIKAVFNIVNNSSDPVSLSDLTIRYYYTLDGGAMSQEFHCDYALVGCGSVSGTFGATSGVDTDEYLEVSFTGATTIAPQGESGEVQSRFNKTDFSMLNQANDYSFDPSKTSFTAWDHVTLYHQGVLAWGVEP